MERFISRIETYGVERPPFPWKKIGSEAKYEDFYLAAGIHDIRIHRHDVGYYLHDADQWWNIVWNAGFRGLVNQLDTPRLDRFKREHLQEIQELATDDGIYLAVEVLFAEGIK